VAVAGTEPPLAAVDEGVAAGLLECSPGAARTVLRFVHPLMASAVYHALPLERRSTLHRRAAEVVANQATALRHEVLARHGPDEALARRLEAFAREQSSQNAWAAAAEALQSAASLSAEPPSRNAAG
jgi:hypothetical protein